MFLGHFFVLKPFPGDPFLDPPISGTPIKENATEVSLLGGECFLRVRVFVRVRCFMILSSVIT